MPIISVILIARNAQTHIGAAIRSVLAQSFVDFEFIIIDDGSTDNTCKIVHTFKDDRIKFFTKDHNYIDNLNFGVTSSQGEFIARIDADDYFHTEKLITQYKRMRQYPQIDICSTFGSLIEPGKLAHPLFDNEISGFVYNPTAILLLKNFIIHSSVMIKRRFLIEHDCTYSSDFPYCEDYNLWYQIANKGGCFYVEPQVLTGILKHDEQVTSKKREAMSINSIKLRMHILRNLISEKGDSRLNISCANQCMEYIQGKHLNPEKLFKFYHYLLQN